MNLFRWEVYLGYTGFLKIQLVHIQNNLIICGKKSGWIYNIVTRLILGGGVISDNLDILFLLTYFID